MSDNVNSLRIANTITYSIHNEEALSMGGIENVRNIEGNCIKQEIPEEDESNEYGYFNYNPQTNINNNYNSLEENANNEEIVFNDNTILMNKQNHPADNELINKLPVNKIEDIKKLAIKKCSICLDFFKNGDNFIILPCIHFFHPECIINWLKTNNVCPLCKFELTRSNIICTQDMKNVSH